MTVFVIGNYMWTISLEIKFIVVFWIFINYPQIIHSWRYFDKFKSRRKGWLTFDSNMCVISRVFWSIPNIPNISIEQQISEKLLIKNKQIVLFISKCLKWNYIILFADKGLLWVIKKAVIQIIFVYTVFHLYIQFYISTW